MKDTLEREKVFVVKTIDDEEMTFEGYLSTYGNADRVGDVIEHGAFDESLKRKSTIPMLFNHQRDQIIGKMEVTSNSVGLYVKGRLLSSIDKAKDVYELLKFGALDSMSIGMRVKDYEPIDKSDPWGAWLIKSAEALEGSVVTIPANDQAVVTSVKAEEQHQSKLEKEVLDLRKQNLKYKIKEIKEDLQ